MDDNLRQLMEKAKEMQAGMQKAQEALTAMTFEGKAGAGMVAITMNGRYQALNVSIDQTLLKGDPKVLADLIKAAINDAVNKVEDGSRKKVADLTKDLQLPNDFGDTQGDGGN